MVDGPIRRACDRCHAQKLSCKRTGGEPCERCVRLRTECTSSPSLRYRRKPHLLEASHDTRRPPKRRRTTSASEFELARGQQFPPSNSALESPMAPTSAAPSADPMLEMVSFQFGFEDSDIFTTRPNSSVDPNLLPSGNNQNNIGSLTHPWSHHLPTANSYPDSEAVISPVRDTVVQAKHAPLFPGQYIYRRQYPSPDQEPPGSARDMPPVARPLQPQGSRQIVLRPASAKNMGAQSTWLNQLLGINSELWELTSTVPYSSPSPEDANIHTYISLDAEQGSDHGFSLDSMFKLSRRLLQHLKEIRAGDDVDSCPEDGVSLRFDPSGILLDPGTGLLVLSTYVRLLDLYQKVFQNVQMEISLSRSGDMFRLCKLPEVSVGSFPVPPSPALQMELTIRLACEFLSQLRATAVPLGSAPPSRVSTPDLSTAQPSMFLGVAESSLREIIAKEKQLGIELDKTRVGLAEMSIMP